MAHAHNTPPITLAVWLPNGVPAFACQRHHALRLQRELPDASVRFCRSERAFLLALRDAQAAIVWRFKPAWLEKAPRLVWLATPSAGKDLLLFTPPRGRALDFTFGAFHGPIMAETVTGWLLALNRGLLDAVRLQERGEVWPRAELAAIQRTIPGTQAVIVGFGRVGAAIGKGLKAFGVRVTGVRRHPPRHRPKWFGPGDRVVPLSELDRLLPDADHLILALPRDPSTDHLIDARRLARLKRHAVVYNVGRGNAIDEAALVAALTSGRLRAACLDVFADEPLPADSSLLAAPNLFRVPHLAAAAPEYLDLFLDEFVPQFRARFA